MKIFNSLGFGILAFLATLFIMAAILVDAKTDDKQAVIMIFLSALVGLSIFLINL